MIFRYIFKPLDCLNKNESHQRGYLSRAASCLTKLTSSPLTWLSSPTATTESSSSPSGPNKASGSRSMGDRVYIIMTSIVLTLGLLSR